MLFDSLLVLIGAGLLLGGGELLVRGAASTARSLGISPMIVGLTVVAFGTSAPEFVVSTLAAWKGNAAICGGNIVGSNILNILLVLGATAVICPLKAEAAFVRREIPIMVAASLLFWYFAADGVLTRLHAAVLFSLIVLYTCLAVRIARRERAALNGAFADTQPSPGRSMAINVLLIVVGLALLSAGAEVFLRGAVGIAHRFNVSEALIGLTLVALGTSLPELAASLVAAYRRHPDICLGNVVGSCTFNLLWIGGGAGLVRPLPFEPQMLSFHVPAMVASAVVLWPIVATGYRVRRREGLVLLAMYAAYLGWTIYLGIPAAATIGP